MRLIVIKLTTPPGDVRTISRSPTKVCVSERLEESAVTGPVIPETAKLITREAPYFGGVPVPPSGIAPTPVPVNVTAVAGVHAAVAVAVAVLVGVLVGVNVFVAVAVGVSVAVLVGVAVSVAVFVGVAVAVSVGVLVGVKVSVAVAVGVSVAVFVGVGVSVAVFVGVNVEVAVGVAVFVAVFVAVNVDVAVAVGVNVGVLVGVNVAVLVGVAAAPVIVKLVLEISKKILPTASTFILAVVLAPTGIVTACEPSFAVLAAKTVGKVCPPSVDNEILTFAQLTGAAVVFATFHVTVCVELPAHETFVFGAVTENGPEVLLTVTIISSNWVCPTVEPGT